jgi:hypothetical protein
MVHGGSRAEVLAKVAKSPPSRRDCRAHDVLFSTGILKKTGLVSKSRASWYP